MKRYLPAMFTSLVICAASSFAQSSIPTKIKIHIVDGNTGSSIQAHQLLVRLDHLETDKNGWIEISATPNESMQFVDLYNLYRCEVRKQGDPYVNYPVNEIIQRGVVSKNFCGKPQTGATPGVIVLYMRQPHWWESTRDFGTLMKDSMHN
jgi:hypothetical protein